jgi:hypothetical protein
MNNPEWTPPPPPQEDNSLFSAGTRDYYTAEAGKQATKALIFGILSLVCCPLIFGILGYMAANEAINNIEMYEVAQDKKALATVGKVLSIIGMVLWGVSIVVRILLGAAGQY